MTDDITTVLIGIIKSTSPQYSSYAESHAAAYGDSAALLGTAANWAQILGTAEGPAAQAAALAYLQTLPGGANAAAQATVLATQAAAAGIGAVIVLGLALVLGALATSSGSGSDQSQQMADLTAEYAALQAYINAIYWNPKLGETGTAAANWSDVSGYLDDLNAQGTKGYQVVNDEPSYHHAAQKYTNAFYSGLGADDYWEAPAPQPVFWPPYAVYQPPDNPQITWGGFIWYGNWPSPAGPAGSGNVYDPTSALPYFILGLNAYLTLESLRNVVNPADPTTLQSFVSDYHGDLVGYLKLLYRQYSIGVIGRDPNDASARVGGIVKSAYPSWDNISAAYHDGQQVNWMAGPNDPWNGAYGAVATYPSFTVHAQWQGFPWWPSPMSQTAPLVSNTLEVCSPSYFFSLLNQNVPSGRWGESDVSLPFGDDDFFIPWVQNKVTLSSMARWKALYLISGYDRVFQLMRSLQNLLQPYLNPGHEIVPPLMYLDDGTRADGNWSAREICNVLQMPVGVYGGYTLAEYYGVPGSWLVGGYSINKLLHFLEWMSGLDNGTDPLNVNAGRPLSFRALLAACDDESYGLPLTPGG